MSLFRKNSGLAELKQNDENAILVFPKEPLDNHGGKGFLSISNPRLNEHSKVIVEIRDSDYRKLLTSFCGKIKRGNDGSSFISGTFDNLRPGTVYVGVFKIEEMARK